VDLKPAGLETTAIPAVPVLLPGKGDELVPRVEMGRRTESGGCRLNRWERRKMMLLPQTSTFSVGGTPEWDEARVQSWYKRTIERIHYQMTSDYRGSGDVLGRTIMHWSDSMAVVQLFHVS